MRIPRLKQKIFIILLLPLFLAIKEYLFLHPSITEKYYSRTLYHLIGSILSNFTGILSFSLAELAVIAAVLIIIFALLRFIYRIFTVHDKLQHLLSGFVYIFCVVSIAYSLFLFLWGFNYYREPLSSSLGYHAEQNSIEDLEALCNHLIAQTNRLREEQKEDQNGIMQTAGKENDMAFHSKKGYQVIAETYPFLGGSYGKPKGIALSRPFSYTGIAGIYFPFTGEANYNKLVPDPLLPATVCHEMAHQRGFAREDEANFIAYLTCKVHPDTDFQYSGYLLATIYSMNALNKYDSEAHRSLTAKYSDGVKRDLQYNSDFWKQFEGPAEELQTKMNDAYLKTNKQLDGVHSYGRMVDLLLAEYKSNR